MKCSSFKFVPFLLSHYRELMGGRVLHIEGRNASYSSILGITFSDFGKGEWIIIFYGIEKGPFTDTALTCYDSYAYYDWSQI